MADVTGIDGSELLKNNGMSESSGEETCRTDFFTIVGMFRFSR